MFLVAVSSVTLDSWFVPVGRTNGTITVTGEALHTLSRDETKEVYQYTDYLPRSLVPAAAAIPTAVLIPP